MGQDKLRRSATDKTIAGVCGGLAAYFDVDATLVRVFFVFVTLLGSTGFWLYLLLMILMPLPNE